jgi:hypothetical protein
MCQFGGSDKIAPFAFSATLCSRVDESGTVRQLLVPWTCGALSAIDNSETLRDDNT